MLSVRPLGLAGGAQVIVGTNRTLEASSNHGTLTSITGDIRVEGGRRGAMVMGWGMVRRGPKGERGEGMERKVATVLLLF